MDGPGDVPGRHSAPRPHLLMGGHVETRDEACWLDGPPGVVAGLAGIPRARLDPARCKGSLEPHIGQGSRPENAARPRPPAGTPMAPGSRCRRARSVMHGTTAHGGRVMPAAMLFTPAVGGISRHWSGDTREEDPVPAIRILGDAAAGLISHPA